MLGSPSQLLFSMCLCSKHVTLNQCWINVGPPSQRVGQGLMPAAGKCVAVSVFCVFHSTFVNYFSLAYFNTNVIWPMMCTCLADVSVNR